MIIPYIAVVLVAYLLGSIPFGYLLVKTFRGQDIRLSGSGNIGATNVVRSGAKGLGAATLLLDAAKGTFAVWAASLVARSSFNSCQATSPCVSTGHLMAVAALSAVLGHIFTVWLRFRGGKGVATALGVFTLLFWKAILICLAVFVVAVVLSRYISLGSILAAASFPIAVFALGSRDWLSLLLISATALIVILKHHENISRLLAGNENRVGPKKESSAGGRS